MNIDRVAQAMTGGRPRPAFKACVMAGIHGRPRPDFTARVMKRVAVAQPFRARVRVAQPFRARVRVAQPFRARVLLIPAAVALAAGGLVLRASRVPSISAPAAPRIAGAAYLRGPIGPPPLPLDRWLAQPGASRANRVPKNAATAASTEASVDEPAIFTIAPLERPDGIAIKSIELGLREVPALSAPVPLKVTDLPALSGGSRDQNPKEKP